MVVTVVKACFASLIVEIDGESASGAVLELILFRYER